MIATIAPAYQGLADPDEQAVSPPGALRVLSWGGAGVVRVMSGPFAGAGHSPE